MRGTVEALDECFDGGRGLRGGGGSAAETHPLSERSQVPLHRVHVVIHSASLLVLPVIQTVLNLDSVGALSVHAISTHWFEKDSSCRDEYGEIVFEKKPINHLVCKGRLSAVGFIKDKRM